MSASYNTTLPALLIARARESGDKIALREKELGVWRPFSFRCWLEASAEFAAGLKGLGFGKGDVVILIGDNRPEWLFAEIAIQALGGIALGLYQDAPAEEVRHIFELSEARLVVAEDQEQVDKMLELKPTLTHLQYIIYHDPKGMSGSDEPDLMSFEELRGYGKSGAGEFESLVEKLNPDDPCLIATTSGTTGKPKLAVLSHKNVLSMAWNLGLVDPRKPSDEFVSFLPLAWMGEQMLAVASALLFGFCVNFPEEPDTVWEDVREIGPHLIFSPPRVWENLAAKVKVKILETTPFKRFLYNLFLPVGMRYADAVFAGKTPGPGLALAYFAARICLFNPIRDRLGFARVRSASTGGAALGPDTFRFFRALGVNLKQIYGQTEIAGISCIHRDGEVDFTSVGKPIPETDVSLSPEGEILSKSPAVFLGYYKNPEATAEALEGGWLHSGDAGLFDEKGRLVVIDRVKDVSTLADGTKFSPQFVENKIKFSAFVREAAAFGEGKPYVAAIVCIDFDVVGRNAELNGVNYTTYQDLAAKPEVYAWLAAELDAINRDVPKALRVKRFGVLFKDLDADDDELTRTRKVRRKAVTERYAALIDALYTDAGSVDLAVTIRYQDGRSRELSGPIRLETLNVEG